MSRFPDIVITRDDGTKVRPLADLWDDMTRYDFNTFHGFGLYVAIATRADGVTRREILRYVDSDQAEATEDLLSQLLVAGFLSVQPNSSWRYSAEGLEDVR